MHSSVETNRDGDVLDSVGILPMDVAYSTFSMNINNNNPAVYGFDAFRIRMSMSHRHRKLKINRIAVSTQQADDERGWQFSLVIAIQHPCDD